MTPLAAIMDTVRVTERRDTPLARTGFYDRVERVKKSAMLGEFITPEELEAKNNSRLSDILQGRQYARIAMTNLPPPGRNRSGAGRRVAVVLGRARCAMNIVVDGQFVSNTAQETALGETPTSIRPTGSANLPADLSAVPGLDDIVDGHAIMGIEIYPSIANAPVELIPTASHGACGLVAIWTGARR